MNPALIAAMAAISEEYEPFEDWYPQALQKEADKRKKREAARRNAVKKYKQRKRIVIPVAALALATGLSMKEMCKICKNRRGI